MFYVFRFVLTLALLNNIPLGETSVMADFSPCNGKGGLWGRTRGRLVSGEKGELSLQ